jgi:UDP-N-acetylmuramate dehydrogenase
MAAHDPESKLGGWVDFAGFTRCNEPLAPYTRLRVGGPADLFGQPRGLADLTALMRRCSAEGVPLHVLGAGCAVLVRDEGVRGVVVRLGEPAFTGVAVEGQRVRAGGGASLAAVVAEGARHGLAGMEVLVGIPGTVGGAVRGNAGDRAGEIGLLVRSVEVLDEQAERQTREHDELRFGHRSSNLDDPVIVSVEFELEADRPEVIVKHMRKAWIQRKAGEPLSFQAHARLFRDPPGMDAAALIEQAGLGKARAGGAEISDRHANSVVLHPGGTAGDVLRLLGLVRDCVRERVGIDLELELAVW